MQDSTTPSDEETVGHMDLVGLKSPILCERGAHNWEVIRIHNDILYFVFPPMSAEGVGHTKYPRPDLKRFPPLAELATKFLILQTNKMVPALDPENPRRLFQLGSSSTDDAAPIFPADTVVLRIIHKEYNPQELITNALTYIRRMTGQFWISQPTTYLDGPKSLRIPLYRSGGIGLSPLMMFDNITNEFPSVIRCTKEIWDRAWTDAMTKPLADSIDIVHDAYHRKLQEPFERFLLDAGLAVEKLKYWLWDGLYSQGRCKKSQHKSANRDTSKAERYFGPMLYDAIGRSLLLENKDTYSDISRIWLGRGLAAHSKESEINRQFPDAERDEFRRRSIASLFDLREFVEAVLRTGKAA